MRPPSPGFSRPAVAAAVAGIAVTGMIAPGLGARWAGYWLALVMAGFAVARALLPDADLAPFAVRDRWIDSATMAVAAVALAVATAAAPL